MQTAVKKTNCIVARQIQWCTKNSSWDASAMYSRKIASHVFQAHTRFIPTDLSFNDIIQLLILHNLSLFFLKTILNSKWCVTNEVLLLVKPFSYKIFKFFEKLQWATDDCHRIHYYLILILSSLYASKNTTWMNCPVIECPVSNASLIIRRPLSIKFFIKKFT